ncbi:MAG: hypothetical protein MRY83_13460 [Flavobacteriales bacterium]|nr:hypothetical protein [Flavobacteriales bacterium]
MRTNLFFIIIFLLSSLLVLSFKSDQIESGAFTIEVGDSLYTITYDKSLQQYPFYKYEDGYAKFYYETMEERAYDDLLYQLKAVKGDHNLSDWQYFLLLHKGVDSILVDDKDKNNHTMLKWFLLAKSDFNVRLEYFKKELTLYVHSPDVVYGWPSAKSKGGYYVDLTSYYNEIDYQKYAPMRMKYRPVKTGTPFHFSFDSVPKVFNPKPKTGNLSFSYYGKQLKFDYEFDDAYVQFLKEYPEIGLNGHSKAPFSDLARNSLVKQIRSYTDTMKSESQKVEFILTFVRRAFGDPSESGVIEFPEECLSTRQAGTEDKVIIFIRLVKDIVGLDAAILKYSKRYTAAVCLSDSINAPVVNLDDKDYFISDPTEEIGLGETPSWAERKTPKHITY